MVETWTIAINENAQLLSTWYGRSAMEHKTAYGIGLDNGNLAATNDTCIRVENET